MSIFYSHINTAITIIKAYKTDTSFAAFIKQYFSKEKKYGSRDRKQIASLCYNYFRVSHILKQLPVEETILQATFLCNENSIFISKLKPEWLQYISLTIQEKISFINPELNITDLFPLTKELNEGIDVEAFCKSMLEQPAVFIRIRPTHFEQSIQKIKQSNIPFSFVEKDCVQFEPGTKIESFLIPDKEVLIQDFNSQKVLNFLMRHPDVFPTNIKVWDCCAASGGKSILLTDRLKTTFKLTVSDIRESIINNLKQRFKIAGIQDYQYLVTDISSPKNKQVFEKFDLIICDAPCSGSGTWSRTPEQFRFFKSNSIKTFARLQQNICLNVLPQLKTGGLFFYITCSVFEMENGDQVRFLKQEAGLELLESNYLYGFKNKADSMFVAVFKKK